jgi:protein involved in plasmid replication-relaxation
MILTARDHGLLLGLAAARWLSTGQIASAYFTGITPKVLQRRLRLLRESGYLASVRAHPMAEALHTLGADGRAMLLRNGWPRPIALERRPPKNLEHFIGINDIRVAVERSAASSGISICFLYASWELQQRGWSYTIVPDLASRLEHAGRYVTVLFEYDRGYEGPGFMLRTKFARYAEGLDGFPFGLVIAVVETEARREQLCDLVSRRLPVDVDRFAFILHSELQTTWSIADLFRTT